MARDGEQLIERPGVHREAKQMLAIVKMLCSQVGTVGMALEESQDATDKQQEEEQQSGFLPWPVVLLPVQLPVHGERVSYKWGERGPEHPMPSHWLLLKAAFKSSPAT